MWEFLQHLGHLVAPFPTSDVNDHVRVAPLGDLVLGHRLACTEPSWDGGCATLGQREEGIEHTLSCDEQLGRWKSTAVGTWAADRPALEHREDLFSTSRPLLPSLGGRIRGQASDGFLDGILTWRSHPGQASRYLWRHHDPVLDRWSLRYHSQECAFLDCVTDLNTGRERPFLLAVQWCRLDASSNESATAQFQHGQRSLDAIEDALQQSGPQLYREWHSGAVYGGARAQSRRFFVDLDGDFVLLQADGLAHQMIVTHLEHFEHAYVLRSPGTHNWPVYPDHLPYLCAHGVSPIRIR